MKLKRVLAWAALVSFAVLILLLLVLSFTGVPKEYLLALLFLLMIVPTVIYIFLWTAKLVRERSQGKEDRGEEKKP